MITRHKPRTCSHPECEAILDRKTTGDFCIKHAPRARIKRPEAAGPQPEAASRPGITEVRVPYASCNSTAATAMRVSLPKLPWES